MIVVHTVDRASPEEHFVFGEGASLVGEYVLYLAQLFGDVHRSALRSFVGQHVEKVRIVVDVIDLQDFAQFHCDVQRHRNHYLKEFRNTFNTKIVILTY